MSQKVLQISAEDAKYIDPNQVVSLTMVDGSTIYVKDDQEEFLEENQEGVEEMAQQAQPEQQQQPLRGVWTNLALGVAAAATAALGAAALGKAIARPRPMVGMMGPTMGVGMRPVGPAPMGMRGPGMAPMGRPMGAPMGRPMGAPMMGPRYY